MNPPINPLEVPPYQLQKLVSLVNESRNHESRPGNSTGKRPSVPKIEVTHAQAMGSEIYVGCSDGSLLRFALQADDPNSPESYSLLSRQSLPTNKAIDEIALAPSISRALILSSHQIHFYTLPSLDPVPVQPIRNVIHFAIDNQHMHLPPPSASDASFKAEPVEFCVIKRNNIAMYSIREKLFFQQEIPIPQGATLGRRTGRFLCVADKENYNMIDLHAASLFPLLPISQAFDAPSTATIKPSITVISDEEFLILSSMGATTMGVFITGNGDPVRGTLEWPSHPKSICLDYPYIVALLPNGTIEIHSLETQAIVQVISQPVHSSPPSSPSLSTSFSDPRSLASSLTGYLVPSTQRTDKLRLTSIPLIITSSTQISGSLTLPELTSEPEEKEKEPSPPPPPPPPKSIPSSSARPPVFPRSNVLVLVENEIQSLLPSTLISQADALLESHRIGETVDLADQNRRKMLGNVTVDEDQAEELRYIYQRVGFQCLSETLFEDAGKHLLAGEVDPRLLIRYFPDLRGNLLDPASTTEVYAGVAEHLTPHGSIDDIVRNYSPHLAPNTRSAPPTAELRRMLGMAARDMLAAYLRKCRTRRLLDRTGGSAQANPINVVVDTVLVKILAESEETTELYTLIDGPNDVILDEVEQPLKKNGQYNALCKLHEKYGNEGKLLEAWSQLADGVWTDEDIPNPLAKMTDLLAKTTNRALVQYWGVWLTGKDAELGLKLLISRDSKRSSRADDAIMLDQIRLANPSAGARFLEYLLLQKRSKDPDLHKQLASACVDELCQALRDEATSKLWRAKASSYASSRNDSSFLSYFASTTPESEHKRTRLKASLFLQGSSLYDIDAILHRLQSHQKILHLEIAILLGKLGRHQEALTTLVHEVHDATSAEAYCTLGGDVISGKVALAVGEKHDLQAWAALVAGGASAAARQKTAAEGTQKDLLRVLLTVYMSGGAATTDRTQRLLNSQAINLDVVDVISLVPPDWSLSDMTSFLARSFRRTLHEHHEGQILKAISSGQNLEVAEKTWEYLREQGAVVEEPLDGEDDEERKIDESDEKHFTEKIGLDVGIPGDEPGSVAEINVDSR